MNYQDYFKGKKITVMGAGLLGGIADIQFLAEAGADLIVTDLLPEEKLATSIGALQKFPNVTWTLGKHDRADFKDRDLIIKAPGTPFNSPFIGEAKKNGIPVTMWAALFARFARSIGAPIVGVTGTRGKTTTTVLITEIVKRAGKKVISGGNVRGTAMLPNLPNLTSDSFVVLELDSWKLQGFREEGLSPNIAVFTTFYPDHLNYYEDMDQYLADKAAIFQNQSSDDTLIVGSQVSALLQRKYGRQIHSHVTIVDQSGIPSSWKVAMPGEHNRYNAALATSVARVLGIDEEVIQSTLASFQGVPGRLELVAEKNGVKIYNDTTATTPEATMAALHALHEVGSPRNIILIMGGADKGLNMSEMLQEVQEVCKKVILLSGTGTNNILAAFPASPVYDSLPPAVSDALNSATPGDVILFSPGFASFGMFKNEYDRGDQFTALITNKQ